MRLHPCLLAALGGALLAAGCGGDPTYLLATVARGDVPAATALRGLAATVDLGDRQDMTPTITPGANAELTLPATFSLELGVVDETAIVSVEAFGDGAALVSEGSTELAVVRGETLPVTIELGRHVRLTPDVDAATDTSDVAIDPVAFVFGTHTVGTTRAHTFVVGNSGTGPSMPLAVAREGLGQGQFAITRDACSGVALAPSATCELDVSFEPSAVGSASATIVIEPYRDGATAGVAGAGVLFDLAPAALAFGAVALGGSATDTITVTNRATNEATQAIGLQLAGDADFALDPSSTCSAGQPLGPGASCSLVIRFAPTATGARSATLSVTDRATVPLALSGTGG